MCNKLILQFRICSVTITHRFKKACNFFVVSEKDPPFLGMPDIELLVILMINCNTIDTESSEGWWYTSKMQDAKAWRQ